MKENIDLRQYAVGKDARLKRKALLMAVITTFLWSGSYILNKLAFAGGIGPLTLSGLRYGLAGLLLLCLGRRGKNAPPTPKLGFWRVVLLGVLGYAVAQGLQYMGQAALTPTQSSLFLSVGNTLLVMLADRLWLHENQTPWDLLKLACLVLGITLYYYPLGTARISVAGVAFMALSSVGYALNMTANRRLLTAKGIDPKTLVAKPMLAGGGILLAAGLATEGLPVFTPGLWLILLYLSCISGALGFTLWTKSQQHLTTFESSGINNLMLVEIALMDFLFFGRTFSVTQVVAIALVLGAVAAIQGKRAPAKAA